jgi:cytochrome c553
MKKVFIFLFVILTFSFVKAEESHLHVPKAKSGSKCVSDPAVMRTFHMDYLKHDRKKTMREGKRNIKHSLEKCINCHVVKNDKGKYPNISTKEHFCSSCHTYVAVQTDCFACHRSIPELNKQVKK